MTTLSKEEFKLLLSNSVASADLDKVQDAIADLVTENEQLKADLSKYRAIRQYKEARRAEVAVLHEQLTATRNQLAAAEAREKLQIDALLTCQKKQIINECAPSVNYKTFDSDLVAKALAQPRDDSALREMIARVYEECAKLSDSYAYLSQDFVALSEELCALAEKAKGK